MTRVTLFILLAVSAHAQSLFPNGLSRFAGAAIDAATYTGDNGPAYYATFVKAQALARDAAGNLYIADSGRVRKIDTHGVISTIASVQANGIAIDSSGAVYVSVGMQIQRIGPSGTLTTIAGSGASAYNGEGVPALSAGMQAASPGLRFRQSALHRRR